MCFHSKEPWSWGSFPAVTTPAPARSQTAPPVPLHAVALWRTCDWLTPFIAGMVGFLLVGAHASSRVASIPRCRRPDGHWEILGPVRCHWGQGEYTPLTGVLFPAASNKVFWKQPLLETTSRFFGRPVSVPPPPASMPQPPSAGSPCRHREHRHPDRAAVHGAAAGPLQRHHRGRHRGDAAGVPPRHSCCHRTPPFCYSCCRYLEILVSDGRAPKPKGCLALLHRSGH